MTVSASTKARVFAMLKTRGAIRAVLSYNGGNDEGGVDEITLVLPVLVVGDDHQASRRDVGDDILDGIKNGILHVGHGHKLALPRARVNRDAGTPLNPLQERSAKPQVRRNRRA